MIPQEIACQDFVELVTDYLERALPPPLQADCAAHLSSCPPCQIYLEQMRQTIELLGRSVEQSLDVAARERLVRQFRSLAAS